MERLFVDTSAWYAFANADDRRHEDVAAALKSWAGRLVTTDFVFDELVTLLRYRAGHSQAVAVGSALVDGKSCLLVSVEPNDFQAAWQQFSNQYDQRLSFTDCTSFAVMRRLKLETAAALDDDFAAAGFTVVPA